MKLRFSMRTMFAVVTLVAAASAYVAHENRIVQERKAIDVWASEFIFAGDQSHWCFHDSRPAISWIRRLLGDQGVVVFRAPPDVSERELDRIKTAFPEARIELAPHIYVDESRLLKPMPGDPPLVFDHDAKP